MQLREHCAETVGLGITVCCSVNQLLQLCHVSSVLCLHRIALRFVSRFDHLRKRFAERIIMQVRVTVCILWWGVYCGAGCVLWRGVCIVAGCVYCGGVCVLWRCVYCGGVCVLCFGFFVIFRATCCCCVHCVLCAMHRCCMQCAAAVCNALLLYAMCCCTMRCCCMQCAAVCNALLLYALCALCTTCIFRCNLLSISCSS